MNEGKNLFKQSNANDMDLNKDYDYLTSACSSTDCTGLIPANPQSTDHEEDPYEDVFPYQPPKIVVK